MAPDGVVDYLRDSIFLEHHANEIMVRWQEICSICTTFSLKYRAFQRKSTAEDKNRELLKLLKQRGPLAFGKFVEALQATEQTSLVELLESQQLHSGNDSGNQGQSGGANAGIQLRDVSGGNVTNYVAHQGHIYVNRPT